MKEFDKELEKEEWVSSLTNSLKDDFQKIMNKVTELCTEKGYEGAEMARILLLSVMRFLLTIFIVFIKREMD